MSKEITLICNHQSGSVAFSEGMIEGLPAPVRKYHIVDGKVKLSGHHEHILAHDVHELLNHPHGLYRMPTPQEQEEIAAEHTKAKRIQEGQASESEQDDTAPDTPLQGGVDEGKTSKKKVIGG